MSYKDIAHDSTKEAETKLKDISSHLDIDITNITENITVLQNAPAGIPSNYLDTDGTLATNSDTKVATQKATKTYVDTTATAAIATAEAASIPISYLTIDGTLASDSDVLVPSEKAVKTYVDAHAGGGSATAVALVQTSGANQTIGGMGGNATIAWGASTYDSNSIHSTSVNPSRFTVPAGFTYARMTYRLAFVETHSDATIAVQLYKNGAQAGVPAKHNQFGGGGDLNISETTFIIQVTTGDYIELNVNNNDSVAANIYSGFSWADCQLFN